MPLPNSFLKSAGIGLTSIAGYLGLKAAGPNINNEAPAAPSKSTIGIGAATTTSVLAATFWAQARYKNPWISAVGTAIAVGGAYATTRGFQQNQLDNQADSSRQPLSSSLLSSALGLSSLYYGGKTAMPYMARSLARLDTQMRPWAKALGRSIEDSRLGNLGEFGSIFQENFAQVKNAASTDAVRFPIQKHLDLIYQIRREISNTELSAIGQRAAVEDLVKKYTVSGANETINGIRSATLADALKHGNIQFGIQPLMRAGLNPGQLSLGKNVLYDTQKQAILNLNKFSAGNIINTTLACLVKHTKLPILDFNPLQLFRPTEFSAALKQGTKFMKFPAGSSIGPGIKAGKEGAAYIGGNLFDINTGKAVSSGGFLIKTGSYHTLESGERVFREKTFGRVMRQRQGAMLDRKTPPGKMDLGHVFANQPTTKMQKILNWFELDVPFMHQTGFSEYPSIWERLWQPIKNKEGTGGIWQSLKSIGEAAVGTSENKAFASKRGSVASVFPTIKKEFKTASGKISTSESGFAFLPYHDLPGTAAFWLTERPMRLMEAIGFGSFDPRTTKSASDVMWKLIVKRWLPAYTAWKMLQATNDVSHSLFNYGPLDLPADILAASQVGAAYLRDVTGVTAGVNYLEGLMPGSVNSSGMSILRGAGMPLAMGAKYGPQGLAIGAAASFLLGGTSTQTLGKSGDEIQQEYYGQKRVPIKKGRWWLLGSSRFEGDKVTNFSPNWYRRMKSRYQYTDVQYGSEGEYWSNFFNPNHYAIKHYKDRPYPLTTSGAEEIPFIGPSIAGMFSPPMMMHGDYLNGGGAYGENNGITGAGIGPGGITGGGSSPGGVLPGAGGSFPQPYGGGFIAGTPEQGIPYGTIPGLGGLGPQEAISPYSIKGRTGEQIYRMTEWGGIYGFMLNAAKARLTGDQDFFTQPQLESANRISSAERAYWQMNLGDPGYTELLRRFIPHERHQIEKYNPIPNQSPAWLPGQEYFKNFQTGDPFTKAGDYGEIRLPGGAYEKFYQPGAGMLDAANQLGIYNMGVANTPSNYSMLDINRVLADVAPYSQQYKYSAQYIQAMAKAGMLTPEGDTERKLIKKEVTAKKKRYNFISRRFTEGALQNETITVGQYLGAGRFTTKEEPGTIFDLAGLKTISPEGEAYIQKTIKPGESLTVQTLADPRYRKKTSTTIPTVPTLVGGLNRDLLEGKMAEYKRTGPGDVYAALNMPIRYNQLEQGAGRIWEGLSHAGTPLNSKFMRNWDALETYERTQVYGRESADWMHPVRDFLTPMWHKAGTSNPLTAGLIGGVVGSLFGATKLGKVVLGGVGVGLGITGSLTQRGIPKYRQKERDIEQYFDILEYLKYQRLYSYARGRAIQEEGMDPELLMKSVEASRAARKEVSRAITTKYGFSSLDKLKAKAEGDEKKVELTSAEKQSLKEAQQFLSYQKWTEDEALRLASGGYTGATLAYRQKYKSTMYGADVQGDFASLMRALPTKEREFFNSFIQAPASERGRIKEIVPLGMRRFLEAKWGDPIEDNPNLEQYFKSHKLPAENWVGYHPAVNLDDVKLKVARQEGLDLHDFNLWESQERTLRRKPYVPLIDPFNSRGNPHLIKQELNDIMSAQGYNDYDVYVQSQTGNPDMQLSFDIKHVTEGVAKEYITKNLRKLVSNAMVA
jgi:hypothetical protein